MNCHPHEATQNGGCTWSVEEEFEAGHLTIRNVMERLEMKIDRDKEELLVKWYSQIQGPRLSRDYYTIGKSNSLEVA